MHPYSLVYIPWRGHQEGIPPDGEMGRYLDREIWLLLFTPYPSRDLVKTTSPDLASPDLRYEEISTLIGV
jgi:hypothetical protein